MVWDCCEISGNQSYEVDIVIQFPVQCVGLRHQSVRKAVNTRFEVSTLGYRFEAAWLRTLCLSQVIEIRTYTVGDCVRCPEFLVRDLNFNFFRDCALFRSNESELL
jgi:hypothetical protein